MDETNQGARKKLKVDDVSELAPLRPLAYTLDQRDALRTSFQSGDPFPHATVSDLCEEDFLRRAREEIITQLKADYKETDIFKVYQTGPQQSDPHCLRTVSCR